MEMQRRRAQRWTCLMQRRSRCVLILFTGKGKHRPDGHVAFRAAKHSQLALCMCLLFIRCVRHTIGIIFGNSLYVSGHPWCTAYILQHQVMLSISRVSEHLSSCCVFLNCFQVHHVAAPPANSILGLMKKLVTLSTKSATLSMDCSPGSKGIDGSTWTLCPHHTFFPSASTMVASKVFGE